MIDRAKLFILFVPGIFSKTIFQKIEKASDDEWQNRKAEKNGSEMFLFFKR